MWSSYLIQFRTIIKMHGRGDNGVMVFKLVEALQGSAHNSLPAEISGSFPPYVHCLKDVLVDRSLQQERGAT